MIYYSLPTAGTLIQERSDIPSYRVLPMEGGILLDEALIKNHTGALERTAYASFMSQKNCLADVGHSTDWSLDTSRPIGKMPAQGDVGSPAGFTDLMEWSGSLARFAVGSAASKLAVFGGAGYVRLYPDRNLSLEFWEGAVLFSGYGTGAALGADVKETLSFTGNGTLELRES
jgi:hypothetical protein